MKIKYTIYKAVCVALLFLALSCVNDNNGVIDIQPDMQSVSLVGMNPQKVAFNVNKDWYVRVVYSNDSVEKWLNVNPVSGGAGEQFITIQALSYNYSGNDRIAEVFIRIPGDKDVVVSVLQRAVNKPRKLSRITRMASGFALSGPSVIDLEYGEDDNVTAFHTPALGTNQGLSYALSLSGSSSKIVVTDADDMTDDFEYPIRMLDDVISETGTVEWTFSDPLTGTILQVSRVTFNFRYQGTDNKRIKSVTRNESFTVYDGRRLDTPLNQVEYYHYIYDDLLVDSVYHILPYQSNYKGQVDTLAYKFNYATVDDDVQENNITANVWDMMLMPDSQGVPFYSMTGYWLFGLTGVRQGTFPLNATIDRRIHTDGGSASAWAKEYIYTYQRNAMGLPSDVNTQMLYDSSGQRNVSFLFEYEEEENDPQRRR